MNAVRIARVVSVFDTREMDETGRGVRGTGDPVPCQCCGRIVEVHARVEYVNGIKDAQGIKRTERFSSEGKFVGIFGEACTKKN
jgi:hypothetical protein